MRRLFPLLVAMSLVGSVAIAQDTGTASSAGGSVPTTVKGGTQTFKEGGREMGAGFRGVGRGVKDVFTGKPSKYDFKQGEKIGTGAADVGKGVAGMARGVGRDVKKSFKEDGGSTEGDE